jgi:hypothetical protein
MTFRSYCVLFVILAGCGNGGPKLARLDRIDVRCPVSVPEGASQDCSASGVYSDGSSRDLSSLVSWSSLVPEIGMVSATGHFHSTRQGTTTLVAALDGVTGKVAIDVGAPVVASIAITPGAPRSPKGLPVQFTATAELTDGTTRDVTREVQWASSDPQRVGVTAGLATPGGVGRADISATMGGVSTTVPFEVSDAQPASLQVMPVNPKLPKGTTRKLVVAALFTDQTVADVTAQATFSTADDAIADVADGAVRGVAEGEVTITARFGTLSATNNIVVTSAALTAIEVSPAREAVTKGTNLRYAAFGTYSDGSTLDITGQVRWSSQNVQVAALGSDGVAHAIQLGTATVRATLGGISGETVLMVSPATVTALMVMSPGASQPKGATVQLGAMATLSDGVTQDVTTQVSWTSSNPSFISITPTGQMTAIAPGSAVVSVKMNGVTGQLTVTVTAAALSKITISTPNALVAKGMTEQLSASGSFSDGTTQDLTSQVTWQSSNPAALTVSNQLGAQGQLVGVGVGQTTITASWKGVTGQVILAGTAAVLKSLAVEGGTGALALASGLKQSLVVSGSFSDGSTSPVTQLASFTSSNPAIASASNATTTRGQVTALAPGAATVTIALDGVSTTLDITVTAATVVSFALDGPTSVGKGLLVNYIAQAGLTDGTTKDITASCTFTTSDAGLATVVGPGAIQTAIALGTVDITAKCGALSQTITLTVGPTTIVGGTLGLGQLPAAPPAPGQPPFTPPTKHRGETWELDANALASTGFVLPLTARVLFISETPNVCTVRGNGFIAENGLVQAIAPGDCLITVNLEGIMLKSEVTVLPAAMTALAISASSTTLYQNGNRQLRVQATYGDGAKADVTYTCTYASRSTSHVDFYGTVPYLPGMASAVALGAATVDVVAIDGVTAGTIDLTVGAPRLDSISITPVDVTIPNQVTQTFRATGTLSDGTTTNITSDVVFVGVDNGATFSNTYFSSTLGSIGTLTSMRRGTFTVSAQTGFGDTGCTATPTHCNRADATVTVQ